MIRAPAAIDFESFFRLSRDLMCVATADGYFERANDAWQRVLGYSIEELQSRPYIEFVHPDDRQATTAAAGRLAGNSEVVLFENRFRAKDGSYHWLVWNATVSPDGRYRYAVARDITERKAEEQQTRLFTSENPNPVLRIAADGTILFANPAGQLLLNHWHVRLHDKAPEELVSAVARTMSDTGRSSLEVQAGKGTFAFSIVRVLERGYTNLFGRDITDQKRIEEQYREAQRMEAIGRVAGGVAHDFNNLLSAILGFSAFLLKSLDPHDPRRADVEEIRATGERAAALTRQLLAFSRKQVIKPTVVDLNGVVSSMQKLIRRLLSEDIEMDLSLAPDLWPVKADLSQMEQVIMNLCVNARDAMPKGGKLSIRTENVVLDPTYSKLHFDTRPGEYAMIAVSDTGVGMTEEVRSHIFEPFFTTKREGKGTGLGLAAVYGIVKQSAGNIYVYSEPGHGSVFKIYFPREREAASGGAAETPPAAAASPGTETILLAEDDPTLRKLVSRALRENGYKVLVAADGQEALEIGAKEAGRIDLLLTDVVMPKVGGAELARKFRDVHPEAKLLVTSGYADVPLSDFGEIDKNLNFLQKPFTPDGVLTAVRRVLHATAAR